MGPGSGCESPRPSRPCGAARSPRDEGRRPFPPRSSRARKECGSSPWPSTHARQIAALTDEERGCRGDRGRPIGGGRRGVGLPAHALIVVLLRDERSQANQVLERVVPERRSETEEQGGENNAEEFHRRVIPG